MTKHPAPRPLPNADGTIPDAPEAVNTPVATAPADVSASTPIPKESELPYVATAKKSRPPSPIETLVAGIRARAALVAKDPETFPKETRSGLVMAQTEAVGDLRVQENAYAEYFKQAAVAGIVLGDAQSTQDFVDAARKECSNPLVVVSASELYLRLAAVAEPGLGATRLFGSGQVGLIITEMAAIGKDLFFSSLASPRWSYDNVVPTLEDLADTIRVAIRSSTDGDELNRAYIRMAAFRRALELGCTTPMIPVLVTGATLDEVQFLTTVLFNSSTLIDLADPNSTGPDAVKVLLRMRDLKRQTLPPSTVVAVQP